MMKHLRTHKLLSDFQYGFLKGRSTADLMVYLTQVWANAIEHHGESRVISLDISKAFDRVWHSGILVKLTSYGFAGHLHKWLTAYLSQRQLFVTIDDIKSSTKNINAGVPQGSVLGPTLFLIFINDLLEITDSQIHSFADDTTLHSSFSFKKPPKSEQVQHARESSAADLTNDLLKTGEKTGE